MIPSGTSMGKQSGRDLVKNTTRTFEPALLVQPDHRGFRVEGHVLYVQLY